MLGRIIGGVVLGNFAESFVDNVFRDMVTPVAGSIVYCDLLFGGAEHSGVCVGQDEIVQLSKSGRVELVGPSRFIQGKTAVSIYVSCYETSAVGDVHIAERARSAVGGVRNYNLLLDNCHQFSAGCLTGDFESANNFLWMLKDLTAEILGANTWRVWDLSSDELFGYG